MEKQKNVVSTGIKVKKSRTDRIFDFFLYLIAFIIILIVLYPMYFIVIASISSPAGIGG